MVVGEVPGSVDLLVVGGGPGGYAAALRAAQLGRNVTLVDTAGRDGIGGACLHQTCIPSRGWYGLASEIARTNLAIGRGLTGSVRVDLKAIKVSTDDVTATLRRGVLSLLDAAEVEIFTGSVNLTRKDQAAIAPADAQASFVEFKDVIFATGSTPAPVAGIERDGAMVLNLTDLYQLETLPRTAAVIGAGLFGLEAATALARLGVAVTLIERESTLLGDADEGLGRAATAGSRSIGIDLLLGYDAVGRDGHSVMTSGAGERSVAADVVVLAAGRLPNTGALGLDAAGIEIGSDAYVAVDSTCRAGPGVYAVGDIAAPGGRANDALAQGLVAAESASGLSAEWNPLARPFTSMTEPEIAWAGLTEAEARAQGFDARRVQIPVRAMGAATLRGIRAGLCAMVYDAASGAVLGVHIAGPDAAVSIGQAVVALEMGATLEDLALMSQAHPTMSEQLTEAALVALGTPLHAPQAGATTTSEK